jgi:hypothetical protein
MNRVETSDGILKYKNPGIVKTMEIMRDARKCFEKSEPLEAKIAVIEHCKDLFVYDEMKEIKTWEQLDAHGEEMTIVVNEVADVILEKVIKALTKKTLSPMP